MEPGQKVLFGLGLETGVEQVSVMLGACPLTPTTSRARPRQPLRPPVPRRIGSMPMPRWHSSWAPHRDVTGSGGDDQPGGPSRSHTSPGPPPSLSTTRRRSSSLSVSVPAEADEEMVSLGVPHLSPAGRVRALEEAIIVVRALSGGGEPVTFDGEFYRVTELAPATATPPPIWIGALGPKTLAVTGRLRGRVDTWTPRRLAQHVGRRITTRHRRRCGLRRKRPKRRRDDLQRRLAHRRDPLQRPATTEAAGSGATRRNGSMN